MCNEFPSAEDGQKIITDRPIGRRRFLQWAAGSLLLTACPQGAMVASPAHQVSVAGFSVRKVAAIQMLLAGSTWWTLRDDVDAEHPLRAVNLKMLQQTPPRFARLLGVPVVHASHAGPFQGFDSPELPDVPYRSVYLGETMITDGRGR